MPTLLEPLPRARIPSTPGSQLTTMVAFVLVTGILYFGRDVLVPLALSVLLTFLLAPGVRWLERRRFPRVLATSSDGGTGVLRDCRPCLDNGSSVSKLRRQPAGIQEQHSGQDCRFCDRIREGSLSKARQTLDEIGTEIAKQDAAAAAAPAPRGSPRSSRLPAPGDRPVPVTIEERQLTPFELMREVITPLIVPLTVAGAVILFTFIMLLQREDLRDRMIRLVGHGQLNVTTQVFEEAANRVSRYLRVQLIVNVSYGLPVGIALYLIGIPNAALWGVLATALRFIPYLGAWIAAALPIALAFAISDDWSLVVWTVAVFVVLELISNNVIEPWAYGASTGMSALAVIVAAIFWTWLWGAVGLLLAVPLTVCLVVVGRYIPQFSFLSIMLGDQPVLSLQDRIYQRLLARDQEEAAELAEEYVGEKGLEALYEDVLIPVLDLAERDRHSDALSEERTRFVFDSTRTLAEDLYEHPDEEKEPTESAEAKERTAAGGAARADHRLHRAGARRSRRDRRRNAAAMPYSPQSGSRITDDRCA